VCTGCNGNLPLSLTICRIRVIGFASWSAGWTNPLNLATSRCTRTLCPNGTLLEVVHLDGIHGNLNDEELDRFVGSFPVNIMGGFRK
jgi:hypothetical protein